MGYRVFTTGIMMILMAACTSKSERAFMTGCVADESMKDKCECVYEELQDTYSDDVFEKMERGYVPPNFLEKIEEAGKMCR